MLVPSTSWLPAPSSRASCSTIISSVTTTRSSGRALCSRPRKTSFSRSTTTFRYGEMEPVRGHGARSLHGLVHVHPFAETPKYLAEQHRGLYQFLLNKWYFDELYDFLFVRSAKRLGHLPLEGGDGRVIDGYGRTDRCARSRRDRPGGPPADRIPLPLRVRHADRYCSARYMDDARSSF